MTTAFDSDADAPGVDAPGVTDPAGSRTRRRRRRRRSLPSKPARARGGRGAHGPRGRGPGRDLPVAVMVGIALAGLFLGAMAAGPYPFLTFVAAFLVIAQLELDSAFRARQVVPATPVAIGAGLVMLYGGYANGVQGQAVGLVVLILGAVLWALLDTRRRDIAASLGATCLIGLWVPFLASFVSLILRGDGSGADGRLLVMAVFALTITNDIGAYAFGNRWGRHRMAPAVSPAKTWEGFVGGFATVLALAGLATSRLIPALGVPGALALGAGIVCAATLGDLSESLVKRDLGLKDLGRVLPGHGGVMDRIDGVLFALPIGHYIISALS